jgi:hypothetical protein
MYNWWFVEFTVLASVPPVITLKLAFYVINNVVVSLKRNILLIFLYGIYFVVRTSGRGLHCSHV